jgi:hypothetical protein
LRAVQSGAMFHACHRRHGGVKVSINESVFTQPRAGANAGDALRLSGRFAIFGCHISAVAQLFSLIWLTIVK